MSEIAKDLYHRGDIVYARDNDSHFCIWGWGVIIKSRFYNDEYFYTILDVLGKNGWTDEYGEYTNEMTVTIEDIDTTVSPCTNTKIIEKRNELVPFLDMVDNNPLGGAVWVNSSSAKVYSIEEQGSTPPFFIGDQLVDGPEISLSHGYKHYRGELYARYTGPAIVRNHGYHPWQLWLVEATPLNRQAGGWKLWVYPKDMIMRGDPDWESFWPWNKDQQEAIR